MIKRLVLLLLLFNVLVFKASASHLMGGDITWTCQSNGQFLFEMKVYRDCNGIPMPMIGLMLGVHNNPLLTSIPLTFFDSTEISPVCNGSGPTLSCGSSNPLGPIPGTAQMYIFHSNPITLNGVPPPQGWIFTYGSCCRNAIIDNLVTPGSDGFTLRAIMYPYNGQNTNPCFDSSPQFAERAAIVICGNDPFNYNHNAFDPDLDSLVYSWAAPLDNVGAGSFISGVFPPALAFQPGYSMTNPFPGPGINPSNIPASLDPSTGNISFATYFNPGFTDYEMVTCIQVTAYRCGYKVAEVYREIQVTVLNCGANSPPTINAPFLNPFVGPCFSDTVSAGTLVTFTITAVDNDPLPTGGPQTVSIDASGGMFGAGFSSTTTGCFDPPCAVLNPVPIVSGLVTASISFSWQTECQHVNYPANCGVTANTYTFVIKAQDDYCPAPKQNIATISIVVQSVPTIESPDIKCVSVLPNGDVQLTWATPPDPAVTFNSYHIWSSATAAGPYTLIDSIFIYNQTTYTHVGAGAQGASIYYYIESRSGCMGSIYTPPIDTVQSILLNVVNTGNGYAQLSWNPIHNPNISTSTGIYNVYREFPVGVWTFIGSTTNLMYQDTINICNSYISYRVEIADQSGCVSVSSVDGDTFQDIFAPATPLIDSVTVNQLTGAADIGWAVDSSGDTQGYVIFQFINGVWQPIDTAWGINNTFMATGMNATNQSDSFRVAAFDSCMNISLMSDVQNTLYLTGYIDPCTHASYLSWNPYINWTAGVGSYNIYVSINGGPMTFVASVPGNTTAFIDGNLIASSTYCYMILAVDGNGLFTSESNHACVLVNVPPPPQYNYLMTVTVVGDNRTRIDDYIDASSNVALYKVLRSKNKTGTYDTIATVAAMPGPQFSYFDMTALVHQQSYYYKIVVIDSCGDIVKTSNIGRSILLKATMNDDVTNTVTWNDYDGWDGGIGYYNIFRSVDGIWDPNPVGMVPYGGMTTFRDDVSLLGMTKGMFCYSVQGYEAITDTYGFADSSLSNQECVIQPPHLFIPNAFTPLGLNPYFRPVVSFVAGSAYSFEIFDRWGELIFETNDRFQGWDGTYKGVPVQQAIYVYVVRLTGNNGDQIRKIGSVTVVK